jgi:two-component system chemotaxis response regulator CheY
MEFPSMTVDASLPVLVVAGAGTATRIIRNLLSQLGFHNIEEAPGGRQALDRMRGARFGLVIADWNMAPMTGCELLKDVRADRNLKDARFIMVTAESKTGKVACARSAPPQPAALPAQVGDAG